jgi:chromosome segregation ATPase
MKVRGSSKGDEMAEVLEEKIQALLARRVELSDRLGTLEKLKAETNDRVYKRIRQDYEDQLGSVLGEISQERGALEGKVRSLKDEIDKKEKRHQEESDKVDELFLRGKLKEFDANDNSFRGEIDEAKGARDATASDLERLRSELADLTKVLRDVDDATSGRKGSSAPAAAKPAAREKERERERKEEKVEEPEEIELEEEEGKAGGTKCPSCGHANPPQKLFCENCGSSLDEEETLDEDFDLVDDDLDL